MKKSIILTGLVLLLLPLALQAQTSDYKVVFDVTSSDSLVQRSLIRWLNGISKEYPNAQMEVVFYGKSLGLVNKEVSIAKSEIGRLAQNKNIAFKVCAVAMKNQNVKTEQLITGVQTVPDGIYEIVSKQKQGWGYIKAAQ